MHSNLRKTTNKCTYLARRGVIDFRLRDEMAVTRTFESATLKTNFTPLSCIEPDLMPVKVIHCGNMEFCASSLDLE